MFNADKDNFSFMIAEVQQEAKNAAWSSGVFTFLFVILIVIALTILATIFFPFANMLVMLGIFTVEGLTLFIPVLLYFKRAEEYMRNRCLELDDAHPGFYNAYEEWKDEMKRKSFDGV